MYRVVLLAYRKPGMTPDDFKKHYEESHVPLMKKIGGDLFPVSHSRRYISRSATEESTYAANLLSGSQSDFPYDAITEMVFTDQEHFGKFSARLMEPEYSPLVKEDCACFLDMSRAASMAVLSEFCETS